MEFFKWFRPKSSQATQYSQPQSSTYGAHAETLNFNDPRFLEYIRSGEASPTVSIEQALKNPSVFRCVGLISNSLGRIPVSIRDRKTKMAVETHPLFDVLQHRPNGWQTPIEFKSLMQLWLLVHGNAYALKIYSGSRLIALHPIEPFRVTVRQLPDWSFEYFVSRPNGGDATSISADEILHLRALSHDGVKGMSMVQQAAEAIQLSRDADRAASRMFTQGMMAGGALVHPHKLGKEGTENLRASLEAFSGSNNAGKWLVLEEAMDAKPFQQTSQSSQHLEMRNHQIEEIGRVFGVPRPFMGVDDTSWGSGIEQLKIMFVDGGLSPWFTVWEEGLARACFTPQEQKKYYIDFDERELLRGSMKDQAEFLAKASGSGGSTPWMEANEAREYVGLPPHRDGSGLHQAGQAPQPNKGTPTP